jgi:hypothetical protein
MDKAVAVVAEPPDIERVSVTQVVCLYFTCSTTDETILWSGEFALRYRVPDLTTGQIDLAMMLFRAHLSFPAKRRSSSIRRWASFS